MADTPEDDELLLEDKVEGEQPEPNEEEQGSDKPGDEGEDELEIVIGDEPSPSSPERDNSVIRQMREKLKQITQERDEALSRAPAQPAIDPGPRPTLADFDYDEDKHAEAMDKWYQARAQAEAHETETQRRTREANEAFRADSEAYEAAKVTLKVKNREAAESAVAATLDFAQQAVLRKMGKDGPAIELALGTYPEKLAEVASIKDPIKFAFAVGQLKGKVQMTSRRKAPDPETVVSGNATVSHESPDKKLERLQAEADKTGDRSKVAAFLAQQKSQRTSR